MIDLTQCLFFIMLLFGVRIMDGCMGEFCMLCAHMDFTAFFFSVFFFWSGCMIPPQFLLGLHMMEL